MRPTAARLLNILVPVKRCVDYAVKIRVNPQQTGIDTNVKHSMNPFDEIGAPRACSRAPAERLKDAVKSITVVTLGPAKSAETLRTALAMGADRGVHVELPDGAPAPEPLGVARALRAIIARQREAGQDTDLVILGKQAIDDDLGQTGQMLAALLGAAQATCASRLEVDVGARVARVRTEIDGGAEELVCRLPAVVTTDLRCVARAFRPGDAHSDRLTCARVFLRLNEPRYASLPNIMKAKKKPIERLTPADLGVDLAPVLETIAVAEPPKRVGGGKVRRVSRLVVSVTHSAGPLWGPAGC
ncbi:hypothetical protein BC834DRAFT_877757 [Gloeopeniophorella convolvens]|nr:hypothetical protein BC834DRAFT_877757 [Gloeopeniophorella convolvens]